MKRDFDTVIFGCTAFGMGLCARDPENTLILEASSFFGGEFTEALRECGPVRRPEGEAAAFYDECVARGVTDEKAAERGEIHLPAVNVILNRIALEKKMRILFSARVIDALKEGDGVRVRAVCRAQILTFFCRRVIDTRPDDFARVRAFDPGAKFALSANLYAPFLPSDRFGEMRVRRGYLEKEAYLTMPVAFPCEGDREKLLIAFAARPEEWREVKLLHTAQTYAVSSRLIREENETGVYLPGCAFSDPFSAFAAGLCGEEALK